MSFSMMLMMSISIFFIFSSFSYWTMWIGLEMFNFFFIPWLVENSNNYKSSKIFLYFIVQFIASGLLLVSMCNSSLVFFYMSILSMFIKLGGFPFHMWVLLIIENMDWNKFSFLMTLSKLGPISILFFINPMFSFIKLTWGGLFIPLMGLKFTSIRKMLTFSSIAHMSWIITCISLSKVLTCFYIMMYWFIFVISCTMFNIYSMKTMKDMFYYTYSLMYLVLILSLMGFPPFLGFFPKVYTLKIMCKSKFFVESIFLSIMSIIPFFFYLKMMIMMYLSFNYKNLSFFFLKSEKKSLIFIIFLIVMSVELTISLLM